MEKLEPVCTASGNVKWCSLCGKQHGVLQKVDNRIAVSSCSFASACIDRRRSKRYLHAHVHSSIILSSYNVEATECL